MPAPPISVVSNVAARLSVIVPLPVADVLPVSIHLIVALPEPWLATVIGFEKPLRSALLPSVSRTSLAPVAAVPSVIAPVPAPEVELICRVPATTVVPLAELLAPERTCVPVPVLTSATPVVIEPEKLPEASPLPTEIVPLPAGDRETLPAPLSPPTVAVPRK